MTTTDLDLLELAPEKQKKIAEQMNLEMSFEDKQTKVIRFTLITPINVVICTWLDPEMGFFQIDGEEEKGFFMVKDLPGGSMITGTRVEAK